MGVYGFLGGRNVNKDGGRLEHLGNSQEPCLGIGVVGRKLALKGPHKQIRVEEETLIILREGSVLITWDHKRIGRCSGGRIAVH